MSDETLNHAVSLIKAGDKQGGAQLLSQIAKNDPRNDAAWSWLAVCFEDLDKKKYCLKKALAINPENQIAKKALAELIHDNDQPSIDDVIPGYKFRNTSFHLTTSSIIIGMLFVLIVVIGAIFLQSTLNSAGILTQSSTHQDMVNSEQAVELVRTKIKTPAASVVSFCQQLLMTGGYTGSQTATWCNPDYQFSFSKVNADEYIVVVDMAKSGDSLLEILRTTYTVSGTSANFRVLISRSSVLPENDLANLLSQ